MTRVLIIRAVLVAVCWLTLAVVLGVTTARYADARNPTPTTNCCAAGTHGNAGTNR